MTISFVGWASRPADNGTNTTVPCTITTSGFTATPATNDLLIFLTCANSTSNSRPNSISATGGQTWNTISNHVGNGSTTSIYASWWATYTGSFSANPSFTNGNGSGIAYSGLMLAFRSDALVAWAIDVADTAAAYSAPGSPFNVTVSGQTPTSPNTVSLALFNTIGGSAPTWSLQTGGWTNPGGQAQWRNTAHASFAPAYLIQSSAVATGSVTNQQSASLSGYSGMVTFTDGTTNIPLALPISYQPFNPLLTQ